MNTITASIITIGDELLIGQVIDTNSSWMAEELNRIGITVTRRVAVGDNWDAIWLCLDQELANADLVLVTGGLGATADDITKELLCRYFGGKMVVDEKVLTHLNFMFAQVFNKPLSERNARQAEVPDNCRVLHNAKGTAPGMWFEKNNRILVSLPGVPFEMKSLMTGEVLPALQNAFTLPVIQHRTLLTAGIGESYLADRIHDFETSLPSSIKLAYLPHFGMVRLRLSSTGFNKDSITREIDAQFTSLQNLLADVLVTNKDETIEKVVADLLVDRKLTIGTAESCTGGYIAHLFTSMPGSSRYFKGSIVSYSNSLKQGLLKVEETTLQQEGAVSEATVVQMVKGALVSLETDLVIACSGIMGPDGGIEAKPVGTVWIAVGNNAEIIRQQFKFRFDRNRNIDLTAVNALNLCRQFILSHRF